ncbi:MAG: TonB-dependent receptor [Bacteroidetes bacterium]|nr:TonB-dependent receptor [Bacteroidota bacterium]
MNRSTKYELSGAKKLIAVLALLFALFSLQAQEFVLSGYVKDNQTKEALVGASIAIVGINKGVLTDATGFFELRLTKGDYTFVVSYFGYAELRKPMSLTQNTTQTFVLQPQISQLEKVVVSAVARNNNVVSTEMGTQTLQMREIKTIPVIFGENDILKTIQLLPGVQSAGEGNSGFNVRGGGADQNLVLLDNAPIYNASHVMGFFSIFNGDAIAGLKLHKGSMPPEYGGRLSSVLDVTSREGDMQSFHVNGGIGTISSRLTVEGPIVKDKASFIVSGRRSYADVFLKFSQREAMRKTRLFFYDVNGKITYSINPKNRLSLSVYTGTDKFMYQNKQGIYWGNTIATLRWAHYFKPNFTLNSYLIYSNFQSTIAAEMGEQKIKLLSGVTDFCLKEQFSWRINSRNTLKFGFESTYHTFNPGTLDTDMTMVKLDIQKKYGWENGIYISNDQSLTENFKVNYGFRISTYSAMGPGTVYTYNSEHQKTDSTTFGRGEFIKTYPAFEPRLAANYIINKENSIKASYTRTQQYVHLIQGSTISLPLDYWIPSTALVKPEICNQYSVGYFRNFADNMYETSAELYYKDLDRQIDYQSGTNVFLNADIESYLLFGKGKSYGLELFAKKSSGDFTGWISYTLSKTQKKIEGLNNAQWFPVRNDRRNSISVVGMYKFSEKWQFAATWVFANGEAVTLPAGKYKIEDFQVYYFTERNGYRMPNYHRMDVSATYTKRHKRWESEWNFSIYNVYNRKNAFFLYFDEPGSSTNPTDRTKVMKVTLFPILPAVTWNFRF